MRSVWGWSVLLVMGAAACGRTELESPTLVASITPLEQSVKQGATVSWLGIVNDPSARAPTFNWRLFSRPSNGFAVLNTSGPNAQLRPDQPGDWVVELQVAAEGRVSLPVVALLHVQPSSPATNHPPVANAGPAQTVVFGTNVTLDGSGSSDLDGDPLDFTWTTLSAPAGVSVSLPGSPRPGFTAMRAGLYEFLLRVTDPFGANDTATVSVEVLSVALPDAGPRDAGVDAGVSTGTRLDPGEIYLLGTVQEGACYRDALANILTPNVASVGFDCDIWEESSIVRPSDGRLLYRNIGENLLREYHCDVCSYAAAQQYPFDVLTNDTVVSTPCPAGTVFNAFKVSVEGEVLHLCSGSSSIWRSSSGAAVYASAPNDLLLALGASGWAISEERVINWKTATEVLITGIPSFPIPTIIATRWSPADNAFNVAISTSAGHELWRVDTSGTARRIGAYGPLPPMTNTSFGSKLDRLGRIFQEGRDTTVSFRDIIIRREVGGASTVVYTEATNPLVKIHISSMVTGP